jgi:hypothetical protein
LPAKQKDGNDGSHKSDVDDNGKKRQFPTWKKVLWAAASQFVPLNHGKSFCIFHHVAYQSKLLWLRGLCELSFQEESRIATLTKRTEDDKAAYIRPQWRILKYVTRNSFL